eukprot:1598519-Amphidinium_carterae.2
MSPISKAAQSWFGPLIHKRAMRTKQERKHAGMPPEHDPVQDTSGGAMHVQLSCVLLRLAKHASNLLVYSETRLVGRTKSKQQPSAAS